MTKHYWFKLISAVLVVTFTATSASIGTVPINTKETRWDSPHKLSPQSRFNAINVPTFSPDADITPEFLCRLIEEKVAASFEPENSPNMIQLLQIVEAISKEHPAAGIRTLFRERGDELSSLIKEIGGPNVPAAAIELKGKHLFIIYHHNIKRAFFYEAGNPTDVYQLARQHKRSWSAVRYARSPLSGQSSSNQKGSALIHWVFYIGYFLLLCALAEVVTHSSLGWTAANIKNKAFLSLDVISLAGACVIIFLVWKEARKWKESAKEVEKIEGIWEKISAKSILKKEAIKNAFFQVVAIEPQSKTFKKIDPYGIGTFAGLMINRGYFPLYIKVLVDIISGNADNAKRAYAAKALGDAAERIASMRKDGKLSADYRRQLLVEIGFAEPAIESALTKESGPERQKVISRALSQVKAVTALQSSGPFLKSLLPLIVGFGALAAALAYPATAWAAGEAANKQAESSLLSIEIMLGIVGVIIISVPVKLKRKIIATYQSILVSHFADKFLEDKKDIRSLHRFIEAIQSFDDGTILYLDHGIAFGRALGERMAWVDATLIALEKEVKDEEVRRCISGYLRALHSTRFRAEKFFGVVHKDQDFSKFVDYWCRGAKADVVITQEEAESFTVAMREFTKSPLDLQGDQARFLDYKKAMMRSVRNSITLHFSLMVLGLGMIASLLYVHSILLFFIGACLFYLGAYPAIEHGTDSVAVERAKEKIGEIFGQDATALPLALPSAGLMPLPQPVPLGQNLEPAPIAQSA